ncbi:PAS domain-containing protein [uncultured Campylobacter sp.]|uniref:helix-turn-helix transcriptional regulator n=1 Tax=uncultured Campylobacter sp. TaxID=218934 RepID=UPI00261D321B|nr:PAS domain-containing protein [uncultured Campylobacter sp.]
MNQLLQTFIPTAHLIKNTIGDCEVVIHDMSTPQNSVVFVLGDVTGRRIGQSFDHLVKDVLLSKNFENDCTANYYFTAQNGKLIRSSTSLIRGADGKVVGALCVNIDTSSAMAAYKAIKNLLPNAKLDSKELQGANFTTDGSCNSAALDGASFNDDVNLETQNSNDLQQNILDIVQDLIASATHDLNVERMKKEDRKRIVKFLSQKGIFEVKGAVELVAKALRTQKVTIYSYIDEVKKES